MCVGFEFSWTHKLIKLREYLLLSKLKFVRDCLYSYTVVPPFSLTLSFKFHGEKNRKFIKFSTFFSHLKWNSAVYSTIKINYIAYEISLLKIYRRFTQFKAKTHCSLLQQLTIITVTIFQFVLLLEYETVLKYYNALRYSKFDLCHSTAESYLNYHFLIWFSSFMTQWYLSNILDSMNMNEWCTGK